MEIRKEFTFKGAHRVCNCSSDRCKYSIHGHKYVVEIFISSEPDENNQILDNGQMVYDFGLTKTSLKDFVKSFDNTYELWNKESEEFKSNIKKINKRWVELPFSPSAESLSIMFLKVANTILTNTTTNNGEKRIFVTRVKVHETRTGYAEATIEDLKSINYEIKDIIFSQGVLDALSQEFKDVVFNNIGVFINPIVEQQIF